MISQSCTSKDCDKLAIRSQQTWGEAKSNGVFDLEMANVEITTKKGTKVSLTTVSYHLILDTVSLFELGHFKHH